LQVATTYNGRKLINIGSIQKQTFEDLPYGTFWAKYYTKYFFLGSQNSPDYVYN
jgi:hypothetical protein